MVTAASIVLIVIGVVVTLIGLLLVVGGALIVGVGDRPDLGIDLMPTGPLGGFVAVVGAIVVLFGVLELLSGIFALLGRGWARILAIVMSVLGGLFALLGIFSSTRDGGGPILSIALLVAYVFVIWAMAAGGRYFAQR